MNKIALKFHSIHMHAKVHEDLTNDKKKFFRDHDGHFKATIHNILIASL